MQLALYKPFGVSRANIVSINSKRIIDIYESSFDLFLFSKSDSRQVYLDLFVFFEKFTEETQHVYCFFEIKVIEYCGPYHLFFLIFPNPSSRQVYCITFLKNSQRKPSMFTVFLKSK